MWIVRLALRRPYTFVVAAILLLLLTPFVLLRTPTDDFHRFAPLILDVVRPSPLRAALPLPRVMTFRTAVHCCNDPL